MRRRTLLLGSTVAAMAAAAGASAALWRSSRSAKPPESAEDVDLWSLQFPGTEGRSMSMAALRGKPLLLNFWATWCAPCATEMPLLDQFARTAGREKWNVLALAVDSAEPVHRFLAEHALSLPVAVAGADGLDLSRRLGNTVGALPFTVVFDASGRVRQRKLGSLDQAILADWLTDGRKEESAAHVN